MLRSNVFPQELLDEAEVIDCSPDCLIMKQNKDSRGVCIIRDIQYEVAEKIILGMNRVMKEISGSKNGDLRFKFSPKLTEEEFYTFFK